MRPLDRLRDLADSLTGDDDGPKSGSPAAAAGGATTPVGEPGEVSSAGSGFENGETSGGGADAVPGTPDAVPATRLDAGGEDHPHHEDQRSEDVAGTAPSDNVPGSERDDV
jgi:hypothetical protein